MPPEWLCSSCLQDHSPQSLTPLYLCHATINKDTQRMTKGFPKTERREEIGESEDSSSRFQDSHTLILHGVPPCVYKLHPYVRGAVSLTWWLTCWQGSPSAVATLLRVLKKQPCGLHLLSSDEGEGNGDSFGGDSLTKKKGKKRKT